MKKILCMLLALVLLTATASVTVAEYKINLTDETRTEIKKYSTLEHGDSGSAVRRLQERLIDLGYLEDGQADGVYGCRTEQAVCNFRVKNGFYPYTTVAEDWVLDALFSSMIESN